eukprot:CAMPEP_0179428844 /NCGR_PEP_ID=MMETSP0799-20121207/14399_1 /TAXON_ID=46947 /ORGANISM="Geminigera cryophila, Strain CCMP2564" /LENGTH=72 /DNA_ID=CAMNT_0021204511 /DNA_START=377 /DNA_END=595 /DNA_ORIENTATION=+
MVNCTEKPLEKKWEGALGLDNGRRSQPLVFLRVAADDDRAPRRRTDSPSRTSSLDDMAKSHETRADALAMWL